MDGACDGGNKGEVKKAHKTLDNLMTEYVDDDDNIIAAVFAIWITIFKNNSL